MTTQFLSRLQLSENDLDEVPPGIFECRTLQELDLSENHLHAVPPKIAKLAKLRVLALHANRISQLPEEMAQVRTGVAAVSSAGVARPTLPFATPQLSQLTTLVLSFNPLGAIPPVVYRLRTLVQASRGTVAGRCPGCTAACAR